MVLSSVDADTTNVNVVIEGKNIDLNDSFRPKLVQRSIDLLAGSAYMNANPNWGAPTEPQTIADAKKEPHLHLVFSKPRKVEIPILNVAVKAQEMVITLPLKRAGIWVRTNNGVTYFAKFKPLDAESLQKLLDSVQKL